MADEKFQMIVAGVGGQGSVLISHVIASAAIESGYSVRVGEKFGAAMRGGAVSSHIRIGSGEMAPIVQSGEADAIMALEPLEGLRALVQYLKEGGTLVMNTTPVYPMDVNVGRANYPDIAVVIEGVKKMGAKVYALNATELAIQAGSARTMNSVVLGALSSIGVAPIGREAFLRALLGHVPRGTEEMNERAFELGSERVKEV